MNIKQVYAWPAPTTCTGAGLCGEYGSNCQLGKKCSGSFCYPDSDCPTECPPGGCTYEAPSRIYTGPITDFNSLIKILYNILLPAGLGLGGFFIAKSGYTLMTSEGNPQKVKEGQEELTHAIMGTIFVLLSIVLLRVIINALIGPAGF